MQVKKGKRSALQNAEIMIHQPLGGMQGQAKDMEIAAQHINQLKQRLYHILSSQCGQPIATIKKDCDRDYYMDAISAKAYGLIDTVIENGSH